VSNQAKTESKICCDDINKPTAKGGSMAGKYVYIRIKSAANKNKKTTNKQKAKENLPSLHTCNRDMEHITGKTSQLTGLCHYSDQSSQIQLVNRLSSVQEDKY